MFRDLTRHHHSSGLTISILHLRVAKEHMTIFVFPVCPTNEPTLGFGYYYPSPTSRLLVNVHVSVQVYTFYYSNTGRGGISCKRTTTYRNQYKERSSFCKRMRGAVNLKESVSRPNFRCLWLLPIKFIFLIKKFDYLPPRVLQGL